MTDSRVWFARLLAALAAALSVALLLGGCISVEHQQHTPAMNPPGHPPQPLSDDAAKAQVVDAAKEIVAAARLQGVSATFSFASCNDQGEPPYMGQVGVNFDVPRTTNPDEYFEAIANAMTTVGWTKDTRPWATHSLQRGGVGAEIQPLPAHPSEGLINVYGECQNMTDHHHDGKTQWVNVTAEVQ